MYKLTNAVCCNRKFQLRPGRVDDPEYDGDPVAWRGKGLHVCSAAYVGYWAVTLGYTHVLDASVPADASSVVFKNKVRASALVLRHHRPLREFYAQRSLAECLATVERCGLAVQFLPADKRTVAVCLAAVTQDGRAFWHLTQAERADARIRIATVKQCPCMIQFMTPRERAHPIVRSVALAKNYAAVWDYIKNDVI